MDRVGPQRHGGGDIMSGKETETKHNVNSDLIMIFSKVVVIITYTTSRSIKISWNINTTFKKQ
jgi:hypothetical protein